MWEETSANVHVMMIRMVIIIIVLLIRIDLIRFWPEPGCVFGDKCAYGHGQPSGLQT